MRPLDIVGVREIAVLLSTTPGVVKQWKWRGALPEPDGHVSGVPVWRRSTILKWAEETGRD